jgi:hypothetical protein
MKTTFKIFGLKEEQIIRASWLTSNGIENETDYFSNKTNPSNFNSQ